MRHILNIFVAVTAVVLVIAHIVIYELVINIFSVSSAGWIIGLRILFVILGVSFITIAVISSFYDNILTRLIYRVSAIWLGIATFIFFDAVIYGLAIAINESHTAIWPAILGQALFVLVLIISAYGIIHARHLQITRETITLSNLPASWKGKTVVLVTDLHLGQVRGAAFAHKVVRVVEELRPTAVFIAGDLYDGVKVNEEAIIAPLSRLKSPRGIYFVTGNHEEFHSNERYVMAVRKAGIRVLMNERVEVDGLQIIGVDDHDSNDKKAYPQILAGIGVDKSKPSILIKHQPTLLPIAEQAGISLQVSGHTHLGQMWPFNHVARMVYKEFTYGLHRCGSMQVCTSSGAGTWGPPLRVGTKAEIVEITLI